MLPVTEAMSCDGRLAAAAVSAAAAAFGATRLGPQVFFAFVVDAALYCVWQAVMLAEAPAMYRFTPFFGLAAFNLLGPKEEQQEEAPQQQ